jgi:hypothetical protein
MLSMGSKDHPRHDEFHPAMDRKMQKVPNDVATRPACEAMNREIEAYTKAHPEGRLAGYRLRSPLTDHRYPCGVVAPSLMPR